MSKPSDVPSVGSVKSHGAKMEPAKHMGGSRAGSYSVRSEHTKSPGHNENHLKVSGKK